MKEGNMWELTTPWWEIVLRAFIVYVFVFTLFRLLGKKQLGQTSPFDFVLILIVSESVSNGLTGGDDSLAAALICCATLISLAYVVDWVAFKSKKIETVLDGEARILISNGH